MPKSTRHTDERARLVLFHEQEAARLRAEGHKAQHRGESRTMRHLLMRDCQHRRWADLVQSITAGAGHCRDDAQPKAPAESRAEGEAHG